MTVSELIEKLESVRATFGGDIAVNVEVGSEYYYEITMVKATEDGEIMVCEVS